MEQDNVQYYYDSSADQWWYFDTATQTWLPWQDETAEKAVEVASSADNPSANAAKIEGTQTENTSEGGEAQKENVGKESSSAVKQSGVACSATATDKTFEDRAAPSASKDESSGAGTSVRNELSSSSADEKGLPVKRTDTGDNQSLGGGSSGDSSPVSPSQTEGGEDAQRTNSLAQSDASDRVRDMLARLASTPSLERALTSITGAGHTTKQDFFTGQRKTPAEKREQCAQDDENTSNEDEDSESEDAVTPSIELDPIVRRSTRMLTFKDKGGLAGCLKAAAAQRMSLIEESGGFIPGTEDYRQEAIKRRARQLASQTHTRAQRRWLDAARMASGATPKTGGEKIKRFSDLVDRLREKASPEDGEEAVPAGLVTSAQALTSGPPPPGALGGVDESVASQLLFKPEVDLREQRRRSSGFTGGQQGFVRFADATFRDPNSQLQMKDLLTQQGRRRGSTDSSDYNISGSGVSRDRGDEPAD
ncbi:hypothetical protein TGME49_251840 [Toxoplasma gondii ME49]|uniref:Uncharacterized protein n=3 Tax=Toxoplasma gondii TaxID=5811 RepID=B6KHV0_TOXGV|nr:hypothetical protein TGME49_251840 [Toxoplasma gondii ME49]EPT25248.1 hypothetical protein TGME49_251840 [Toxoplasma gondii ME49]ESS34551.1 hypothetical protein TGVEG_251840 [Toxoplasma gondii VEG]KYF40377.1 hypothetical protein TGARI_251840 [Toxoplasma gondii ARI]CEL78700.1 TPA: hypothetical protein BN1205_000510 [Toxoplasma gondii VEG]|eukprot:XP_002367423.1 hypothetical protein TGME49_251840 [Toxoplasma gondii ME49]